MTDRLEEIRERINAANKTIILGTQTAHDEQLAALAASYQIVTQDASYLLAELERLRAALEGEK